MNIFCSMCGQRKFFGFRWHKEIGAKEINLCAKCWQHLDPISEWFECRFIALGSCLESDFAHKIKIFKLLGIAQSHVKVEDGKWLTEKVIDHLALPGGQITFEFKKLDKNIGGTVVNKGTGYLVQMSQDLQDNFRALSAILIHELMHIYLGVHGLSYKSQNENEELTDLACVLLGFGLPMINAKRAWNVEKQTLGGGGVGTGTSYRIMGYLTEEQIGYSFAYFMNHNNISIADVKDGIDQQCLHIVTDGISLEQKNHDAVIGRRKAREFVADKLSKKEICEFSCPKCLMKMGIPLETLNRVGIFKVNCRKCGTEIHFDGKKVINF